MQIANQSKTEDVPLSMNASRIVANRSVTENANFRHFVYDVVWFGLALPSIDRFREVYAIRLGADVTQLTWMASLPALVLLIASSVAARWMSRYASREEAIRVPGIIFRLAFLLPALTAFFPTNLQFIWLILSVLLPAIGQGVAAVGFVVMMREAISGEKIPMLSGRRMMSINITVALSGLAMGFWLERAPFPFNYQAMFVVAFILSLGSWWHVNQVRTIPELVVIPETPSPQRVNPWKTPAFQLIATLVTMSFITFSAIRPLISLYMVNTLHADEWFFSNFGLVELAAGALVASLTGYIVKRMSNRTMIAVGLAGTGIAAFVIAMAHTLPFTLISAAIGGASWTIVNIGLFSLFSHSTPTEHKEAYTTAYHQITFLALFIGPMIGRLLSGGDFPLATALVIGGVLRVIAGVLTQSHPRLWINRIFKLGYNTH